MERASPNIDSIFLAAAGIPSNEERSAYLDKVCGEQPELRPRIERLLAARSKVGDFLETPAPELNPASALDQGSHSGEDVVGPYKLLEQIGEGGMGLVYMAEQQDPIRRRVALKIVKPGMASRQVIARFEAERQALAAMDHLNIAKVLDAGTTGAGCPYFVMELVKGVPITKFCDERHLTLHERLELFVPVCQALQHAHQKGIIHRDIKPNNVLVALYDEVAVPKVIDFGVAKATAQKLTEKTMFTGFGQLVGTLEYMSPEQAQFNQLDIDTRSDIYSLGVLLYELLTGSTPLEQSRLRKAAFDESLRIIRQEEPPKPSTRLNTAETLPTIAANRNVAPTQLRSQVTGDLDWIVMKALEKDRTRRYETCGALAEDVLRYLRDEPVQACLPTINYRLRKFVRRNKGPVLAGMLVLLALVGGIIGTTWQMILATHARSRIVSEAKEKEAALVTARESERDAKDRLFLALLNEAKARRFSRQMGQRLESLAALNKAARIRPDERLRDEAIAAMALPDVRRVPTRSSAPAGITALNFDGQCRTYARSDAQGFISIRSIADDREIQRITSGSLLKECLFFSSDDQFLLGLRDGKRLGVWRVAGGQRVIQDELRDCWAHAFSPDGQQLAVGQKERVIWFDLKTGQEINRWVLPTEVYTLAFHPEGDKLAVGYVRANVVSVYDAASGALVTELPVGALNNQVIAWHSAGEVLALTGSSDPRVQIWNVAAKRKLATLEGHVQHVPTLAFRPGGDLLASHGWDGVLRLWDSATGRRLLQLPIAMSYFPRFSRDGRWLGPVLNGEQIELLEVTPSREYRTLLSSAGREGRPNFGDCSPDGKLLAVAMEVGTRLWDLPSGRELAALPPGTIYTFFDDGGGNTSGAALLTSGSDGLLRWPLVGDDQARNRLRLGPPRPLSSVRRAWFTRNVDGRSLGVVSEGQGAANQVIDLESGAVRHDLGRHPIGQVTALSGDGRWAASCGWHSDRVRLWNVLTGEMVREWVLGIRNEVYFTPDSRRLIISRGDEFAFWDVETLQPTLRLQRDMTPYPGHVAFSPDGKLMAVEMAPAVVHLKDAVSGRTVAKLEDPHGDRATWQAFTADGTQLVVASNFASAIHIWDLRAIRARLKEMNLDWDWPEFPSLDIAHFPAVESLSQPESEEYVSRAEDARTVHYSKQRSYEPVTMEVVLGDLARPPLTRQQRAQETIERHRQNPQAKLDSAKACNDLAWALVTAPETLRNPEEAVQLAEKALRLISENALERALYRNTLGVAYYRAGRYREAVEILRANLAAQQDRELAFDLYFLAMGYHQLGDTEVARDYYDLAVRWIKAQTNLSAGHAEELAMFKAEAEELLGVKPMSDDLNRRSD